MSEHTPIPWRASEDGDVNLMGEVISIDILDSNGVIVGQADARDLDLPQAEANAEFIVRAVNAFEPMREALERIGPYLRECQCGYPAGCARCQALRARAAALAAAEETPDA